MAKLSGRPLVLVNADAALLMSNKALLPVADKVAFGFDGPAVEKVKQAVVTGNPVRAEIEAMPAPAQRFAGRQGRCGCWWWAAAWAPGCSTSRCPPPWPTCRPSSAAGDPPDRHGPPGGRAGPLRHPGRAGRGAALHRRHGRRLADCDVIVCRAGAITVSELCAAGVASVLVPLVVSTTSHQRDNAAWMAARGAAIHLPQNELNPQSLAELLSQLTPRALLAMAEQARLLARPQAAKVADEIERLVKPT
jgi:UDP-N-acetylglucosamine--N-acetylmuramyl-(pentapeptide) pyrophosphoryl-undecaprenol N-acetylglucosamine transferase